MTTTRSIIRHSDAAADRLADLLDRIDRDGAAAVAAELGEPDRASAHAYLLGTLRAAARNLLDEVHA